MPPFVSKEILSFHNLFEFIYFWENMNTEAPDSVLTLILIAVTH